MCCKERAGLVFFPCHPNTTRKEPRMATARRITRKYNLIDNEALAKHRSKDNPDVREYMTTDGSGFVWRTSAGWAARHSGELAGEERIHRTLREAAADAARAADNPRSCSYRGARWARYVS